MERRHHSTYDRDFWRSFLALIPALLLGGACALAHWLGHGVEWLVATTICTMAASFGYILLVEARWINRCICPGCRAVLRRPPNTREFICADCRVIWWTHAWGSSFWDWFT